MNAGSPRKARKPPRYDAIAAHYDWVMRPFERLLFERLRTRLFAELPESARMLEVGAGTGANFALYPANSSVTASEFSFKMLEHARDKPRKNTVCFVQNCAEELPFADDAFDAAVVTLVFCSVASPNAALTELKRVVRAGGTIALLEHVRPTGMLGYVFDALSYFTVAAFDDHFNRRTADDARNAGLDLVNVESHALGIVNLIVCKV